MIDVIVLQSLIVLGIVLVPIILSVPQGPSYLPPSGGRPTGGGNGHPDDWAGVIIYFILFSNKIFIHFIHLAKQY